MPAGVRLFVRWVDAVNRRIGRFAMYLIFFMTGVLLFAAISRSVFDLPHIWVVEMAQWVKADRWTKNRGLLENLGIDVHHATLGIIGLGRIGREVARRAVGFNMNILYHDQIRDLEAEAEFGAVYTRKEKLLQSASTKSSF